MSRSTSATKGALHVESGGSPGLGQRVTCNICGYRIDDGALPSLPTFPCHIRAFVGEMFRVWRCSSCRTIHCLDVVDLDKYYGPYPFKEAKLSRAWRIFYHNLARRLVEHGLERSSRLLDYGCGNGLFGEYLAGRGYGAYTGFDPYHAGALGDRSVLDCGPFDFILLQDVLEHVEDPRALLGEMDQHLAPGGTILVGTPSAERIDLSRPDRFRNEVHVPYHLHIYTRDAVEQMGGAIGWSPVGFYDRSYHDLPWFGMNTRAAKHYQDLLDGTFDSLFDPFRLGRALSSPRFYLYGIFGYWMSYRSDMSIVFRKPTS